MSTSIGKLHASIASATQETTLALANVNFDFSLVKVEAPPEYRDLGVALSKTRRAAAEDGPAHTTARRLGSLFQSILPETPALIKAYGQRTSEIARDPQVNPKGSPKDGPFREYVGADGTSIWAAATSGSAAIASHLLACMLASLFSAEEAVAIWEEIVTERKRLLDEKASGGSFTRIEDAVAVRLDITREQLTAWDSSARSWLKAAAHASVIRTRQQAIRAALKTIDATVNSGPDVYSSVTEAWKMALNTLESVIGGASYSIRDGSVIIALLSWHLYPDCVILGATPSTEIRQHDPLITPGGTVTIGLLSRGNNTPGVHWSLSLGHMRFYGPRWEIHRSVDAKGSDFSFDDFVTVWLGGIIGLWNDEEKISNNEAFEVINFILDAIEGIIDEIAKENLYVSTPYIMKNSWIAPVRAAVARCLSNSDTGDVDGERPLTWKLFDFGSRRRGVLKRSRPEPMLANEGIEFPQLKYKDMHSSDPSQSSFRARLFGLDFQFSSILTTAEDQKKYLEHLIRKYVRHTNRRLPLFFMLGEHYDDLQTSTDDDETMRPYSATLYAFLPWENISANEEWPVEMIPIKSSELADKGRIGGETFYWFEPPSKIKKLLRNGRARRVRHPRSQKKEFSFKIFDLRGAPSQSIIPLHTVKPEVFLYMAGSPMDNEYLTISPDKDSVMSWLRSGNYNKAAFLHALGKTRFARGLQALSMIARIHHVLPELRMSAALFSQPPIQRAGMLPSPNLDGFFRFAEMISPPAESTVLRAPTGHAVTGFLPYTLQFLVPYFSRAQAFSVIIGCHTGDIYLAPGALRHAFAVSMENSLYIASLLVSDPASALAPHDIRCIRGTTGKPGVSLLSHSSDSVQTEMAMPDTHSWQQVNHVPFQGGLEDCFSSTSLHLRFTGHEQGTSNGKQSQRYTELTYVEAVISVYAESGKWIGDINAIQSLDRPIFLRTVVALDGCKGEPAGTKPEQPLACIENFDELLDAPQNCPGVFKAHGNWQARLAAASICARLGYNAILFKDHGCWRCAFKTLRWFHDVKDLRGGAALKSWPVLPPGLRYESRKDYLLFPSSISSRPELLHSYPPSGSPHTSASEDEAVKNTGSKDGDEAMAEDDSKEPEESEDGSNYDSSGRTSSSSDSFIFQRFNQGKSQFIFII